MAVVNRAVESGSEIRHGDRMYEGGPKNNENFFKPYISLNIFKIYSPSKYSP